MKPYLGEEESLEWDMEVLLLRYRQVGYHSQCVIFAVVSGAFSKMSTDF